MAHRHDDPMAHRHDDPCPPVVMTMPSSSHPEKGRPRMSVSVRIPTILRTFTGGSAEVSADPGTLREVIASLDASYPGLGGRIIDDAGNLRRFVNVYVGDEDVRFASGLDTPVPTGSHVSVIPAVAGG
jgi:sulfur-carrier protein